MLQTVTESQVVQQGLSVDHMVIHVEEDGADIFRPALVENVA